MSFFHFLIFFHCLCARCPIFIEDASARPPHPEEDCAADGYLRWGAGFLQDFADFCRNLCLIFGTRRHHFASIRWRILRLILHRFLFDFHWFWVIMWCFLSSRRPSRRIRGTSLEKNGKDTDRLCQNERPRLTKVQLLKILGCPGRLRNVENPSKIEKKSGSTSGSIHEARFGRLRGWFFMFFWRNSMEFSCVFGVGFSIDFVSKNRSDFHGFSQTAWKNVLVSKPCQSVGSSMTSCQNGLPHFSRNAKNLEKTPEARAEKHPKN